MAMKWQLMPRDRADEPVFRYADGRAHEYRIKSFPNGAYEVHLRPLGKTLAGGAWRWEHVETCGRFREAKAAAERAERYRD